MGLVDGSGHNTERQCCVAGDPGGDSGRKQTRQIGQGNQSAGSVRFWKKGADAVGKIQQRMVYGVPEGAQRIECKTVSGGGPDILRSAATVFDGFSGAIYSAESRRREEGSGVGV